MSKCLEQGSTDNGAARKQEADGDDPECRDTDGEHHIGSTEDH